MERREARYAKHVERRFGQRMKDLRTARNWTQDELAQRMSAAGYQMHQTTVAKMESGARPTSVGEVAALAAIFGLPIGTVFSNDDETDRLIHQMSEASAECARIVDGLTSLSRQYSALAERLEPAAHRVLDLSNQIRAIDADHMHDETVRILLGQSLGNLDGVSDDLRELLRPLDDAHAGDE